MENKEVLFGIRPSGKMHLGHVFCLKSGETIPTQFLIADINNEATPQTIEYTKKILLLTVPNSKVYIQSEYKEKLFNQIYFYYPLISVDYLSSKIPKNNSFTSIKEFTYSILMAADIACFSEEGSIVLVGSDQNINLEIANYLFAKTNRKKSTYISVPVLKNLRYNNLKMSTSCSESEERGVIWIDDSYEAISLKIQKAVTQDINNEIEVSTGIMQLVRFFKIHQKLPWSETKQILTNEIYTLLKNYA